jgi:hypothetical protein
LSASVACETNEKENCTQQSGEPQIRSISHFAGFRSQKVRCGCTPGRTRPFRSIILNTKFNATQGKSATLKAGLTSARGPRGRREIAGIVLKLGIKWDLSQRIRRP